MALLAVHDAILVDESGERPGGVVIADDGRIEAVIGAVDRATAETVIDAGGRLLFPGFVDAHVHMRDPGYPEKETFASGTAGAACGGVTTVMCMPNTDPPVDDLEGLAAMRAAGEGASRVDFTAQAAAVPDNLDRLDSLWNAGVTSFEGLLSDAPDGIRLDSDALVEAARRTAACGGVLGVYTGSQTMVAAALDRLAGRGDHMAFVEARDPAGEARGLAEMIEAARRTGARIVARQVSTARGFALVAAARNDDPKPALAVEVTPHHLRLDVTAVARHGPHALMVPPLRSPADRAAAERAVIAGDVDFVASDHAPHAPHQKERADPWRVPGGIPGLATLAAAVLDLAARGCLSWPAVARLLCGTPARLFGLGDRKGRLSVGMDGDLTLVDPGRARVVAAADVHSYARHTPFEGERLTGWPVLTVLRGRVIAEMGRPVAGPARGRWVPRGEPDWS